MAFDISLPARGTTVRTTLGTTAPESAALLIPVANGEDGIEVPVTALAPKGLLEALVAVGAKGTEGEVTRLLIDGSLVTAFGLGDASEIDDEAVRRGVGAAARALNDVERAAISAEFGVAPVVEGLLLGSYTYTGLKSQAEVQDDENTDAETPQTTEVTVVGAEEAEYNAAVIVAESVNLARDLVNTPANYLYPESYASVMGGVASTAGLDIEVLDESALEEPGLRRHPLRGPRLVAPAAPGAPDLGAFRGIDKGRAGGQGHHLRHRRHLAQARLRHGGHDLGHGRLRSPARRDRRGRTP